MLTMMRIICGFIVVFIAVCGAAETKLEDVIRNELMKKLQDQRTELELPDHKIIGGSEAALGLIPYQAFIRGYTNFGETKCGGSLISRRHVLTAAHCLVATLGVMVTLGSISANMVFGPGVQSVLVEGGNLVVHPSYDDDLLINDIAIIKLPNFVKPSFNIRPIALPTVDMTEVDYFAARQALVSGFGKTTDDFWDFGSEKLMMANVTVTKLASCQKFWKKYINITESQICSTSNGTSTCQGDSGGPMTVKEADKEYLIGITSFGDTRCLKPSPSVYTNVASFLDWINTTMEL